MESTEKAQMNGRASGVEGLGPRPWLVLGGGGMKGLAHVGVVRALQERSFEPTGIVGTSIGALIGVLMSTGMGWEEMAEHGRAVTRADIVRLNRRAAFINGIKQLSLFKGDALMDFFGRLLEGISWDSLTTPVLINAVDLEDGSTEWWGPGARKDISVLEAVYASSALPVFYPPFQIDGHAYVDGGSAHPMALYRAEEEGATGIVGVDPGSGETGDVDRILSQGMLSVHQRIFSIMTWRRRRDMLAQWDGPPVLYVRPELEGYQTFDFDNIEYFIEEGYRAATVALDG